MHYFTNQSNQRPVNRLDPTANQFPLIKMIFGQLNSLTRWNRQLIAGEFLILVDRIAGSELENESISMKPMLFNLQRSATSVRRDRNQAIQIVKALRKIC